MDRSGKMPFGRVSNLIQRAARDARIRRSLRDQPARLSAALGFNQDQLQALLSAEDFPTPSRKKAPVKSAGPMTACLLSWKRPENIEIIVRALREVECIDEILVWNNNAGVRLEIGDPRTRVIQSSENQGCYGRFLCAAEASNPLIYVQDDDVLNRDIGGLYREFCGHPDRITHALSPGHWMRRDRQIHGNAHVALLGWGAIFRKEWLSVLGEVPDSLREEWLFLREADKFFTMLLEGRHHTVAGQLTHLPGCSSGDMALYREGSHRHFTAQAVRESLHLLRVQREPQRPATWNVVIPCYNYGRFLRAAVESVLASDVDYEIQIVDDASTDETPEVAADLLREYPRLHYLRNEERQGAGYTRNRGIAAIDSEFVVLLDADDLIGPDYLFEAERLFALGADVVNPRAILFGAREACWSVPQITTLEMLLERNCVHCCSAFRRTLWEQAGGIDEHMPCWMDYEFWIRLAAGGAVICGLPGDHFFYRQHDASLTSVAARLRPGLQEYIQWKHPALFESEPVGF